MANKLITSIVTRCGGKMRGNTPTFTTVADRQRCEAALAKAKEISNVEKPIIGEFYRNAEALFADLADRWADESEHEQIADYAVPVRKLLPKGWSIVKMTKRPFGAHIRLPSGSIYAVTVARQSYILDRVSYPDSVFS